MVKCFQIRDLMWTLIKNGSHAANLSKSISFLLRCFSILHHYKTHAAIRHTGNEALFLFTQSHFNCRKCAVSTDDESLVRTDRSDWNHWNWKNHNKCNYVITFSNSFTFTSQSVRKWVYFRFLLNKWERGYTFASPTFALIKTFGLS